MKKQIKKLTLNKKTITNLNAVQMSRQIGGGDTTNAAKCSGTTGSYATYTCKPKTCNKKCGF